MKVDRALHDPGNHLSLIIDGADQSAFGLPHFVTTVKTTKGHGLKIKLVGIIQHGTPKKLHLYTMSEEHETGANHAVESLHRCLNSPDFEEKLPRTMYIQLDNCTRENKNHFSLPSWRCS